MAKLQGRAPFDPKALGRNIRFYRKRMKLRQEDLADIIGSNVNTISRIENGGSRCSLETLLMLSHALKVSPNLLLEGNFNPDLKSFSDYLHTVSCELVDHFDIKRALIFRQLEREDKVRSQVYRYRKERFIAERGKKSLKH